MDDDNNSNTTRGVGSEADLPPIRTFLANELTLPLPSSSASADDHIHFWDMPEGVPRPESESEMQPLPGLLSRDSGFPEADQTRTEALSRSRGVPTVTQTRTDTRSTRGVLNHTETKPLDLPRARGIPSRSRGIPTSDLPEFRPSPSSASRTAPSANPNPGGAHTLPLNPGALQRGQWQSSLHRLGEPGEERARESTSRSSGRRRVAREPVEPPQFRPAPEGFPQTENVQDFQPWSRESTRSTSPTARYRDHHGDPYTSTNTPGVNFHSHPFRGRGAASHSEYARGRCSVSAPETETETESHDALMDIDTPWSLRPATWGPGTQTQTHNLTRSPMSIGDGGWGRRWDASRLREQVDLASSGLHSAEAGTQSASTDSESHISKRSPMSIAALLLRDVERPHLGLGRSRARAYTVSSTPAQSKRRAPSTPGARSLPPSPAFAFVHSTPYTGPAPHSPPPRARRARSSTTASLPVTSSHPASSSTPGSQSSTATASPSSLPTPLSPNPATSSPPKRTSPHRKHTCPTCNATFPRPSALRTHISAVHTGARPFVCPVPGCGRAFSVASNMRRHLRGHFAGGRGKGGKGGDADEDGEGEERGLVWAPAYEGPSGDR